MFESKYGKTLTVILVIVVVAIIGLLGFLGYQVYDKNKKVKEASEFVDNYNGGESSSNNNETKEEDTNSAGDKLNEIASSLNSTTETNGGTTTTTTQTAKKGNYKGFATVGTMKIPAINFSYPIIDSVSKSSIDNSVAVLYPSGGESINEPGNTVVIGHNYRNGVFFSNNKKLKVGDKIYVNDYKGKNLTYTIYNKFEANDQDTSFYQRETNGKAELTLSTCTDASNDRRLIILAKQDD